MKDEWEPSYVLGIEISQDRSKGSVLLSQKGYIEKILKRFGMENYHGESVAISKGDRPSKEHCRSREGIDES